MSGSPPRSLGDIFGPVGRLASILQGFEHRREQEEVARAALEIFSDGGILLAEAGTGSGKTIAYLAAALLAGGRVVVSTGTRTLQEQIERREAPVLRLLWPGTRVVVLKGRGNYLCRARLAQAAASPPLPGTAEARSLARVLAWSEHSRTGDRAELAWLPDDDPLWPAVSAEGEACAGGACPHLRRCFVTRARRRAASADVVLVNHHLLMAEAVMAANSAGLLPEGRLLVVDEAHLLEEVAARSLGAEAGTRQLGRLFGDLPGLLGKDGGKGKGAGLSRRGFDLLGKLGAAAPPAEGAYTIDGKAHAGMLRVTTRMTVLLDEVAETVGGLEEASPVEEFAGRRARRFSGALGLVGSLDDAERVRWYERRREAISFHACLTDVSEILPSLLFQRFQGVMLTSATLAVGGSFRYLRDRLGIAEARELIAGSPFDFQRQAVLYLPEGMPEPNSPEHAKALVERALPVLGLTGGRAFVLCTSRRGLDAVCGLLRERGGFRVLRQGEAPRSVLLEEFEEAPGSVLVATTSFWQGVDVPGEALSAVIVDRLPFASPDEPLTSGRIERLRRQGRDPFSSYQLPAAVIMLKQGLGRLIRRATDRGVLAVMDPRIRTRAYGRVFIRSLPSMRMVGTQRELEEAYHGLEQATG